MVNLGRCADCARVEGKSRWLPGDMRNAVLLATRASLVQANTADEARRFAATNAVSIVVARPRELEALRAESGLVVGEPTPLRLAKKDLLVATISPAAPNVAAPTD